MKVSVTIDYGNSVERVRYCARCHAYFVTIEKEARRRGQPAQS
jgi:transcriptional regulator NrdR family protein